MQAIPYTDARNQLARLLDRVTREHQPVLITRRKGEPAVLIALADFEHWRHEHYLLRRPDEARRLLDPLDEIRDGRHGEPQDPPQDGIDRSGTQP